jgi:hypothetical protein
MRDIFIAVHSVAGVVAFGLAYSLLLPRNEAVASRPSTRRAAAALVMAMSIVVVSLAGAIIVDWADLAAAARVAFPALAVLGIVMTARAERARRISAERPVRIRQLVQEVGFVLVGLVDGLLVVFALELGAPTVVLVVLGAGIAAVGHLTIGRAVDGQPL